MTRKFWWAWVILYSISGCSNKEPISQPASPAISVAVPRKDRGSCGQVRAATTAKSYAYPLKVSDSGRYLVDQSNKAFRIQGDSAQSLIANLTYEEADRYLSDRQAKGFNAINANLLEHKFAIKAPANRRGDAPFVRPADFSTPNEPYFAYADSIIDLAASKGMLVSLAPMYLGYGGGDEGWWKVLTNKLNTQSVCYHFGLYVGSRYKDRKNILWVIGGDYMPPSESEGEARLHKIMEGIKAAGATQLWSGDWNNPSLATDEPAFANSMDINAVYTSGIGKHTGTTYDAARRAYEYSPRRPAYLKETGYEDEALMPGDPASVRSYEYWAILQGATAGGFYGHRDIWEFATSAWWSGFPFGHGSWENALNSPGVFDWVCMGQVLDSVPWYDLVPSGLAGMKTLVSEGGGKYGSLDYVAAAATPDGKALLAYVPPRTTSSRITVETSVLRAPFRARWFDPTSGKYTDIARGPFRNNERGTFVVPGMNASAGRDWVLVLNEIKIRRRS